MLNNEVINIDGNQLINEGGDEEMAIEYRKLAEEDLEIFMEMRMQQLQEEGAEATFD